MIQKELAIQKIEKDFKDYADLMLKQISGLEDLIQKGSNDFSAKEMKSIQSAENQLDAYEVAISEQIINVIVLHHPVASELRRLMACYRIIINMERIGDLVSSTVNYIKKIEETKIYEDLADVFSDMVSTSATMVEKALFSFINNDRDSAIWAIKEDEMVDEMTKKILKKGVKKTKLHDEAKEMLYGLVNFRTVVTKMERIADHAGHIAEASIFANEGKEVRHKNIK